MMTIQERIKNIRIYQLPIFVFVFTFTILSFVQVKLDQNPLLLFERFLTGAGWFEIVGISFYAAFIAYKMQNPVNVPKYRRITWTIFAIFFFTQLVIGLLGVDKFLMTGKLHLPIPTMILAGPLYRGQLSVMTILFLSTIILTGPAWCSQFCYFGAFDSMTASGKTERGALKNKKAIKYTLLLLVIGFTLLFRWLNVPVIIATLAAVGFGLAGIGIMIVYSRKKGKMVHCTVYCPIGTMVNVLKPANPFRMYIDASCSLCMKCTSFCKYDALSAQDVRNKKPGFSCTLCGDCLAACRDNSIKYRFLKLKPQTARKLYLILTISIHAIFLALARM